jgi:hypothetical protein
VLNRVVWFQLGPDGDGEGPDAVMRELGRFVCDELRGAYPRISFELTKLAILFKFHEPMDDEDPSVDIVVFLTRRDEPGFWIPNRDRDRWDASDPETHTKLSQSTSAWLRVIDRRPTPSPCESAQRAAEGSGSRANWHPPKTVSRVRLCNG